MSSTSEIQAKFNLLKKRGQNLGAKAGAEQTAGSGGRVQIYERGRIYWHPNTGANEVHGGILQRYLAEGGPGANPVTGRRHFGYPISDEGRTLDGSFPVSRFEFGDIFFVRGMKGGSTIHGDFFRAWKEQGAEIGSLAYPLTEPVPVAGGTAVYFERGCLWKGPATNGEMITSTVHPPLIGKPDLVKLAGGELRNFLTVNWRGLDKSLKDTIVQRRPSLFADIWRERLLVQRVHKNKNFRDRIALLSQEVAFEETSNSVNVKLRLRLPTNGPIRPRDRTLYDLALRMPDNGTRIMAPHAFYMARDWEKFGFIHVTDIHVAKRIEKFHRDLARLAAQKPELREAAEQFNNFNDNFRDFIRYANHLHNLGLLDVILATGDLVDYGFDKGEAKNHQGGNYAFFEQLIRGQARAASGVESEELRVPIFTVFGNHDYRINPYKLLFDLDVPFFDKEIENYSPYNLTKKEAKALQGGHPTVSMETGLKMVKIDNNDQQDLYRYYKKRINSESAYILDLGSHRIVMLDTRFDVGIPSSVGLGTDISLIMKELTGTFSENEKRAQDGGPNLMGFNSEDIDKVKTALFEAGQSGLVIVGMHAPPLNIEGSELAHYFRETEHPTIDRDEVDAFLSRHGASGASDDWPRNGTPHFKTGTVDNLLDDGIAKGEINAFLQTCAGVNASRPVDLVLCGHNHDRVEYRLKSQNNGPGLRYFTDFYLGNPNRYYPSKQEGVDGKAHIRVKDNTSLNGQTHRTTDNRFDPPLQFSQLDVPPYANSLDKVADRKQFKSDWWTSHRPLIVETAALGPLDQRQRIVVKSKKPSVSFQGFRYFRVKQDEIFDSHYVVLDELRRRDFEMPWEKDDGGAPPQGPVKPPKPKPGPGSGQAPDSGSVVIG